MPVYQPYAQRFADPETTKTPIDKAVDPDYGADFIAEERSWQPWGLTLL